MSKFLGYPARGQIWFGVTGDARRAIYDQIDQRSSVWEVVGIRGFRAPWSISNERVAGPIYQTLWESGAASWLPGDRR